MNRIQKAIKWLRFKGLNAFEKDNKVLVEVEGFDDKYWLELSDEEVEYRAELYEEEFEDIFVKVVYFNRNTNVEYAENVQDNIVSNSCNVTVKIDECEYEVEYDEWFSGDMRSGDYQVDIESKTECEDLRDIVYTFFSEQGEKIFKFYEDSEAIKFIESEISKMIVEERV